ncbi:MAG: YfhO family protein [Deltaproteobacteria bacterium]|nr:YfhO family protein [Deltaproteobacteria bacterium]
MTDANRPRTGSRWLWLLPSGDGGRAGPGVAVGLALLVALFWYLRIATTGEIVMRLGSDLPLYYFAIYKATYARLFDGGIPLWNPYQLCGIPWLATLQGGFYYPPHLLYAFLPTHFALALLMVSHLILIGVSVRAFALKAGLSPLAALLAAVLCAMRGAYPGLMMLPNMLEAACWLAPGALAVLSIARGGGTRWIALLALSLGMSLLAGYPQLSVYIVYAWGLLFVAFLLAQRAGLRRWLTASSAFLAAVGIGVLLAGIQVLPTLELTREGTRSLGSLDMGMLFAFGWGGPSLHAAVAKVMTSRQTVPTLPLSLGVVGMALLPAALANRESRGLLLAAAGLALLVLLFVIGPMTPVFDLLAALPALGSFRHPPRGLFIVDFCFALLAALGLDAILRRSTSSVTSAWRSAPMMLAIAASLLLALFFALRADVPSTLFALLVGAAVAALPLWPGRAAIVGGIVLAVALLELFSAPPYRFVLPYRADGYIRVYEQELPIFADLAASPDRSWLWSSGVEPLLPPKTPTLHRFRSITDYEPLNLRRQADFFSYFRRGEARPDTGAQPYFGALGRPGALIAEGVVEERGRLLDLASMRWVLGPPDPLSFPLVRSRIADPIGWEPRPLPGANPSHLVLFENPNALPRAFTTYRARRVPELLDDLFALMSAPDFDPLAASFVEGDPPMASAAAAPARGRPARIVHDGESVVEIEVEMEAPGLAVLGDSFYPGWLASVDGEPATIHPTNHLFRGVAVPEGRHRVRFEYRPRSFELGLLSSGLGLLLVVALFVGPRGVILSSGALACRECTGAARGRG